MNAEDFETRSTAGRRLTKARFAVLGLATALLAPSITLGDLGGEVVAVSAKASDDYLRAKLPDGTFAPEFYTFGEGGRWNGYQVDGTIDKLKFLDVARTIAGPLAERNFLPGRDPKQTKLLIMVYWGTSVGTARSSDSIAYQNMSAASQSSSTASRYVGMLHRLPRSVNPGTFTTPFMMNMDQGLLVAMVEEQAANDAFEAMVFETRVENQQRDRRNMQNARMLGFDSALAAIDGYQFNAFRFIRQDLLSDLEDDRYFVVLLAYDFPLLVKEKKHKLVWETRFSIRTRRHDFDQELAAMAKYASRYFGEDTHGLLRKPLPVGTVEVGDPKVLGYER